MYKEYKTTGLIDYSCADGLVTLHFEEDGFTLKLGEKLAGQIAMYILGMLEVCCGKDFIFEVYKSIDSQKIIDGITTSKTIN